MKPPLPKVEFQPLGCNFSKQCNYLYENSTNNFSVTDTTYSKFLNEYLKEEFIHHKKMVYFANRLTKIKEVEKENPIVERQFKILNFNGYINGDTKLDLTIKDYSYFMMKYYKRLV